jgi:two-component system sensor histidine kinase ChiS
MRILTLTYLFAFALVTLQDVHAQESHVASKGVLDLREYNFKSDGPLELYGEYEFYWNHMLNPAIEGDTAEMMYVQVPGSWFHLRKEHPEIERYGFATYRLLILLPDNVDEIALKIEDVFSASGYFINGIAFDYLG